MRTNYYIQNHAAIKCKMYIKYGIGLLDGSQGLYSIIVNRHLASKQKKSNKTSKRPKHNKINLYTTV